VDTGIDPNLVKSSWAQAGCSDRGASKVLDAGKKF